VLEMLNWINILLYQVNLIRLKDKITKDNNGNQK
jgi:hypothetical protein